MPTQWLGTFGVKQQDPYEKLSKTLLEMRQMQLFEEREERAQKEFGLRTQAIAKNLARTTQIMDQEQDKFEEWKAGKAWRKTEADYRKKYWKRQETLGTQAITKGKTAQRKLELETDTAEAEKAIRKALVPAIQVEARERVALVEENRKRREAKGRAEGSYVASRIELIQLEGQRKKGLIMDIHNKLKSVPADDPEMKAFTDAFARSNSVELTKVAKERNITKRVAPGGIISPEWDRLKYEFAMSRTTDVALDALGVIDKDENRRIDWVEDDLMGEKSREFLDDIYAEMKMLESEQGRLVFKGKLQGYQTALPQFSRELDIAIGILDELPIRVKGQTLKEWQDQNAIRIGETMKRADPGRFLHRGVSRIIAEHPAWSFYSDVEKPLDPTDPLSPLGKAERTQKYEAAVDAAMTSIAKAMKPEVVPSRVGEGEAEVRRDAEEMDIPITKDPLLARAVKKGRARFLTEAKEPLSYYERELTSVGEALVGHEHFAPVERLAGVVPEEVEGADPYLRSRLVRFNAEVREYKERTNIPERLRKRLIQSEDFRLNTRLNLAAHEILSHVHGGKVSEDVGKYLKWVKREKRTRGKRYTQDRLLQKFYHLLLRVNRGMFKESGDLVSPSRDLDASAVRNFIDDNALQLRRAPRVRRIILRAFAKWGLSKYKPLEALLRLKEGEVSK